MTQQQQNLIRRLKIALLVVLILSIYMTGIVLSISVVKSTLNPFRLIRLFGEYGFPWKMFLGCFLFIGIAISILMAYSASEEAGVDKMGRLFSMAIGRKTYGESHFEDPKEYEDVAIIQHEPQAVGTILGQLDETGRYPIVFREDKMNRANRHIAVIGASGCGKTYTFTKNYAFQAVKRRESLIFTDPDGGLYADMARYFMDNGYVVRRFDLHNISKSDGWNCMDSLLADPERIGENAEIFANVIISNAGGSAGIYESGPKSLLKALLLRVALGHDYPPEKKNINSVHQMLKNPGGETYLDMMFDPDSLTPEEQPCVGPYMTFKQSSPNLRGNLIVNLAADIGVMDDEKVRTLLSTPCIDMSLPGKQPCAYFCIFPDSHDTYKFIVSLFFSMLFITLINDADNNGKDRKLDVPVDFLLDEFPSIGTIPDFDRKMATIRKRAMNVCMIFQDITQLQNNYQTTWATLLSNCSTLVSLGINDEFTAKMVSSRIGDTTVNVRTNQHKAMETLLKNNEFLHNWSSGEGKRALVGLDEAFKMGKNDSIIIFQGHNPILAKKYPHTLHTDAKKLSNFDFREIPPITDKEGRELFYQRQQNILDAFNITHPHINEVDRSYTGMCNSIPVQSIWEESKDAVIAYVKEINKKGSDDDVIEVEDCGDEYIEVDETDEEQAVEPSAPPAQQEPVLSVDAKPNADIDLESAGDETEPQQEVISKPKEAPTPAEAKEVAQGGKRPAPPKRSFSSTPTTGKPRMSGKLPGMR